MTNTNNMIDNMFSDLRTKLESDFPASNLDTKKKLLVAKIVSEETLSRVKNVTSEHQDYFLNKGLSLISEYLNY